MQSAVFVGTEIKKNDRKEKSASTDKTEFLKILRFALKTAVEIKIRDEPERFCRGEKR